MTKQLWNPRITKPFFRNREIIFRITKCCYCLTYKDNYHVIHVHNYNLSCAFYLILYFRSNYLSIIDTPCQNIKLAQASFNRLDYFDGYKIWQKILTPSQTLQLGHYTFTYFLWLIWRICTHRLFPFLKKGYQSEKIEIWEQNDVFHKGIHLKILFSLFLEVKRKWKRIMESKKCH